MPSLPEVSTVNMKIHEFLKEDRTRLCRHAFARDHKRKPCTPEDSKARSWNLSNLIKKCYPRFEDQFQVHKLILTEVGVNRITEYSENVELTVEAVIAMLEKLDV